MKTFKLTVSQVENIITLELNNTIKLTIDRSSLEESMDNLSFIINMISGDKLEIETIKQQVLDYFNMIDGTYEYTLELTEEGKMNINMKGNFSLDIFKYISIIQDYVNLLNK